MYSKASSCGDKIKHMSKDQALRHVTALHRLFGQKPHKLQVYECRYCGFWHIGHKPGTKREHRQ